MRIPTSRYLRVARSLSGASDQHPTAPVMSPRHRNIPLLVSGAFASTIFCLMMRVEGPSFKATSGWSSKASEAELKGAEMCRD